MYFQTMESQTWEAIFDQEESKMDERLQKQLAFALEIDKEKNGVRGEETIVSTPDSKVKVLVVPTNEELAIARETMELVK